MTRAGSQLASGEHGIYPGGLWDFKAFKLLLTTPPTPPRPIPSLGVGSGRWGEAEESHGGRQSGY